MSVTKITTNLVSDDAVTLAKMAGGTDGNIISYDASGNPVAIATGNDGQVLTSTGAGSPPAFEDAGGGGAWNLIGTAVASNSASLTVTGINSTYDTYAIALSDMHPADDNGSTVKLRLGDSSGVDTGAGDYHWHTQNMEAGTSGFSARTGTSSEDSIELKASSGGDTGEGYGGMLWLHQPSDGVCDPFISGQIMGTDSTDTTKNFGAVYGRRLAVIAVDRVQVYQGSGNIGSGRLTVWGIAHA